MDWIEISDVIPAKPKNVLLGCFDVVREGKTISGHYVVGKLGGCTNKPEVEFKFPNSDRTIVFPVTHWCKLEPPK